MGHTSFQLDRRAFVRGGLLAAGALSFGPAFLRRAFAAGPVTVGDGPYGPLQAFDANGIALPKGFTSREIARGSSQVAGANPPYTWHLLTDGQATFPTLGAGGAPDGGWILVANSEIPAPGAGGASAVEFSPDGEVERAYRVLEGTMANCAGGPTPWGTWLSGEEHDAGRIWECDPTGATPGIARDALGVFAHEAACVDPVNRRVYLTEDRPDGCFYRFTPAEYPDLSAGLLELAIVDGAGSVTWAAVPDPAGGAANPTRQQLPEATKFNGGEGTWYDEGTVYFTTKGDTRVWALDVANDKLEILYDAAVVGPDAPLSGVDNITVSPSGDVFVCEDGRDHDICMITPEFEVSRFLKLDPVIHSGPPSGTIGAGNETVGVVFNPDGDRMYFGAQRSFAVGGNPVIPAGVVYEISGPFRGATGGGSEKLRATTKRRRSIRKLLGGGLPVALELDRPAAVRAKLRVAVPGGKRQVTVAKATLPVAVRGKVDLKLKTTRRARAALAGRRRVKARLEVTATYADQSRDRVRREVVLFRAPSS
jgi:hypothetical protein